MSKVTGVKHDGEKVDMSLLSSIAVHKIAQVMTFGKRKYSANNWRGGIAYSRLIGAALRHVFAWLGGESLDPETGYSHLAHASCCLMMLLEFESTRPELDDRFKTSVQECPVVSDFAKRALQDVESGYKVQAVQNESK
jgi:hypothetical protein